MTGEPARNCKQILNIVILSVIFKQQDRRLVFKAPVFIYHENQRIRNKETTSLPPEGSRRKGGTNVHRSDDRGSKRAVTEMKGE